jgi:PAS domain S-box-containing protein
MNDSGSPHKILVIDDDQAIRESFADYLEDRDFMVVTGKNGRIGLDLIRNEHPALVLVDLRMPEMDGLEVLRRGREIAPDTPKIVISGANRIDDVVEALHLGAWDYLVKPLRDLSMLDHAVNKALEKARLIRENRSYQSHLETLVRERTNELETANKHLADINLRLRNIVESTRKLSACVDLKHFGSKLLNEFAEHMYATGGSLYMVEKKGLRLIHALDWGHQPHFIAFPLREKAVFNRVLEEKKSYLIQNLAQDSNVDTSGWEGYQDGSALAFPLPNEKGDIIGLLTLHNKTLPPFLEQDKEIGAILSSYSCETLRAVRAFESLKESEKKYRTLFKKTNDAIFILEKSTGHCIDANEAASELSGRSLEELKQMTIHDIMSNEAVERLMSARDTDAEADLGTQACNRPDGSQRIAKISSVPLDDKALICIARDITRDLEVESQLRQSQKMEAIGTLSGGIAHDFNNILGAILGYTELAIQEMETQHFDNKNMEKYLHRTFDAGNRAKSLVHQILQFSRRDMSRVRPLPIKPLIKETVKLLYATLPKTIELKLDLAAIDDKVNADPSQIHQVIMNLCTNAYQAMRENGGRLAIRLENTRLSNTKTFHTMTIPPNDYLIFEVEDSGHGITPEVQDRIFEPYFTTKEMNEGTGLGLSVTLGIIESHNGLIEFESKPGQGTIFRVFLPLDQSRQPRPEDAGTAIPPGAGQRVLLVDDEEFFLDATQERIIRLGYNVAGFRNSLQALEIFKTDPNGFDLIITDQTMPGMTGVQLAGEIRKLNAAIPIILCTGYSETVTKKTARAFGISRYLMKPVHREDLANAIHEVLEGVKR